MSETPINPVPHVPPVPTEIEPLRRGETGMRKLTEEERMRDPKETCATCRFYRPDGQRYGPFRIGKGGQDWRRPCLRFPKEERKFPTDWCGEHQERPAYELKWKP